MSYQREKNEKDPEALFQQRIPKEYLTLQECIRKKLGELRREEKAPVLSEKEFRWVASVRAPAAHAWPPVCGP